MMQREKIKNQTCLKRQGCLEALIIILRRIIK